MAASPTEDAPAAYLLPAHDEYTVAYADRDAILSPLYASMERSRDGILNPTMAVDGQVIRTWKRTLKSDGVVVTPRFFGALAERERGAIAVAAARYAAFLGRPAILP